MLISMPTGTSTIFGAFQAILALLLEPDELRPRQQTSADREVPPMKSLKGFVIKSPRAHVASQKWEIRDSAVLWLKTA
jgi:hypothetical protein